MSCPIHINRAFFLKSMRVLWPARIGHAIRNHVPHHHVMIGSTWDGGRTIIDQRLALRDLKHGCTRVGCVAAWEPVGGGPPAAER